jgi:glycosyltransferase involved in cell wall biosynthesis
MRLLIDTSAISLHAKTLTGIPRVVQNYQNFGYRYGAQHGLQVLPVTFSGGRMVLQRASRNFPYPDGLSARQRRRAIMPALLLALHYVGLALAYCVYAVIWAAAYVPARLRDRAVTATAVSKRLESTAEWLEIPAGWVWGKYMAASPFDVQPEDILFSPAYWHDVPPENYANLRGRIKASYVLVHDIIPVSHPEMYRAPWRDHFRKNVGLALRNFTGVICISQYTADMIAQFFPEEAAAARIVVCRNGLEPLAKIDPATDGATPRMVGLFSPQNRPYLMVGTIEPKKGHRMVLEALKTLWASGDSQRPLVILGRKGWMYDAIVTALARPDLKGRVFWLQDATDAELAYAYRNTALLIHASTVEGFGLPLVEAATYGAPVLSNQSAIAHEVLGRFGLYFKNSADSLAKALIAFETPGGEATQRALMAQFAWPLWQDVVPTLFDALIVDATARAPLPPMIAPSSQS